MNTAVNHDHDHDGEFTYEVSDELLARFATSTVEQRLRWLEEMREFSWEMATPETRSRWRRARAAGRWDGSP
jgi:hypothetical protein